MAKSLQAGKLIIGAIVVSVDPTGTAATTLGIDSALQIKDWLKKTPDLAKLSAELDKAFTAEIAKPNYDKSEGIRTLLPQMLKAGQPTGDDIAQNTLDATLIFSAMQKQLTDQEHCRPENLMAFRKSILPLLEQACNDTRLETALRPALTRAQGAAQREQSADIKAVLAAVQAGQTGIPLRDLQDIAREFGEEITEDSPQVMEFLRSRAADFFAMKEQVDAIPETMRNLANLKSAAQDAIDRVDLAEVEHLMAIAHETELEEAAKSAEIRANTALLRGKVEDAFRYLSAAADSFAAVDPKAPARKRLEYGNTLYAHGLRYGSMGMIHAAIMIRNAVALIDRNGQTQLWASAQNNLGLALQTQGTRTEGAEGAALLVEAVTTYRNALEVYTRADYPVDWAMTQNNLAIALRNQGTRTEGAKGAALLAEAVTAYRNALEVYTRADHPVQWGETQFNIALAEKARSAHDSCTNLRPHLTAALEAVTNALTIFDPTHLSYNHIKATELRERIQAQLDALPPE